MSKKEKYFRKINNIFCLNEKSTKKITWDDITKAYCDWKNETPNIPITLENKKEILKFIIGCISFSSKTNEFIVWDGVVEFYANGDTELTSKTHNLLKLMNEAKKSSEKDFEIFMTRDIEEDLWFVI